MCGISSPRPISFSHLIKYRTYYDILDLEPAYVILEYHRHVFYHPKKVKAILLCIRKCRQYGSSLTT